MKTTIHVGPVSFERLFGRRGVALVLLVALFAFGILWLFGDDLRAWLRQQLATQGPSVVTWLLGAVLDAVAVPTDGPRALSFALGLALGLSARWLFTRLRPEQEPRASTPDPRTAQAVGATLASGGSESASDPGPRTYPLSLRERADKLSGEISEAMGRFDAMSVRERSQRTGFFSPFLREFARTAPELRGAGHMPDYAVANLLAGDVTDSEDPSRGDMEAIVRYLHGLNWADR